MRSRLLDEIKQSKPFTSPAQEAYLSIERTSAVLGHAFAEFVKPFGITPTQFNVLRILRGAGEAGLCRHEIRDRLVAQVPDVTRLIDRLVEMGLVTRERDGEDRRLVTARITPAGLRLLADLDEPVREFDRRTLGHLTSEQVRSLVELLAIARRCP